MRADVLIENFRPGTMARFGLDWETVHAAPSIARLLLDHRVRLWDRGGHAGYDPLIQALSGMMSITGPRR